MRRRASIFGSTGSVGQNTVALLEAQGGPEVYDVVALSGAQNIALLADQARRLGARIAITANEDRLADLQQALSGSGIEAAAGALALAEAASEPVDWGMSAIVGSAGLAPGLQLARHGGVLALANKESLVCAGALLRSACAANSTSLVPVDSEHSAIYQVLRGENAAGIERIILTASGGPFRLWSEAQMAAATPDQAVAHPNWAMGRRISVDSASMFNKALEIIETHELFAINAESIDVVVHPQSIVHSLVEFCDGSLVAQMGVSDMRGPIGFALNWPDRRPLPVTRVDLAGLGRLEFMEADPVRFPALRLARQVLEAGGLSGAVFNAAKEASLDAFLERRIGFLEMAVIVEHVLEDLGHEATGCGSEYDLEAVMALDAAARRAANLQIASISGKSA